MERILPRHPAARLPSVAPARAHELVAREHGLIVDVREPDEWAEARIPGAVHIPLGQIVERAAEIPRDRPVILQCRSGARSATATRKLVELGRTNVHNLEGGIGDWAAEGLPIDYGGD